MVLSGLVFNGKWGAAVSVSLGTGVVTIRLRSDKNHILNDSSCLMIWFNFGIVNVRYH